MSNETLQLLVGLLASLKLGEIFHSAYTNWQKRKNTKSDRELKKEDNQIKVYTDLLDELKNQLDSERGTFDEKLKKQTEVYEKEINELKKVNQKSSQALISATSRVKELSTALKMAIAALKESVGNNSSLAVEALKEISTDKTDTYE